MYTIPTIPPFNHPLLFTLFVDTHPAITILKSVVIITAVGRYFCGKSVNIKIYAKTAAIGNVMA
jgi:hypothetical protein